MLGHQACIAAAVKADVCEICTDVDGLYTTDPGVCSNAGKIKWITPAGNLGRPRPMAWLGMGHRSDATSIRAAAFVVLVLTGSAIVSGEPVRIRLQPLVEVEANRAPHRGNENKRIERTRRMSGDPVAAHIRADDPARIDQIVHAN